MICKFTIRPPQDEAAAWEVYADAVEFEWQLQYPGTATITILSNWEHYYDEGDATSPIQLNAYVTYEEDGATIFEGNVLSISRVVVDGIPGIRLEVVDPMYILKHTYVSNSDGAYIFRDQTGLLAVSSQQYYPGTDYDEFRNIWYPKYDSAMWYTSTEFTVIDDMPGNTTTIASLKVGSAAAGGYPAIPPAGIFKVTSRDGIEFCQYNGCEYNQVDGYWYLLDVHRAMFGSTNIDPIENQVAYSMLCKRISIERPVLVEGKYSGDTYDTPIPDSNYDVGYEDGGIYFNTPPLTLRSGTSYDSMHVTCYVYDEDDASDQLLLSEVFTSALGASVANGGPGFTASDYSITMSPDPVVARYEIREPITQDEFIRQMLFELGLAKGAANDLIGVSWKASDHKLHIDTLSQKATPDRYYDGERSRSEEIRLDDIASAVLVNYECGGGDNLVGARRIWHPAVSDNTAVYPQGFLKRSGQWQTDQVTMLWPSPYNISCAEITTNAQSNCSLTDNDSATGIAVGWDTDPAASGDVLVYAWFPGTSETDPYPYYVSKVIVVLEVVGSIAAPSTVTIYGYTGFTGSTGSTEPSGTQVWIHPDLTQVWGVPANASYPVSLKYQTFKLETPDGLMVPIEAIGIYVKRLPDDGGVTFTHDVYALKILDIYVEGVRYKQALVKLAAAFSASDETLMVAPLSYAKAVDESTPQHIVKQLDLGPSTREVALNLGWLQLLQYLAMSQTRVYEIDSASLDRSGIPLVGETLQMSDGFSGLCDNVRYSLSRGRRTLEVRLINYNTTLFGMST